MEDFITYSGSLGVYNVFFSAGLLLLAANRKSAEVMGTEFLNKDNGSGGSFFLDLDLNTGGSDLSQSKNNFHHLVVSMS